MGLERSWASRKDKIKTLWAYLAVVTIWSLVLRQVTSAYCCVSRFSWCWEAGRDLCLTNELGRSALEPTAWQAEAVKRWVAPGGTLFSGCWSSLWSWLKWFPKRLQQWRENKSSWNLASGTEEEKGQKLCEFSMWQQLSGWGQREIKSWLIT